MNSNLVTQPAQSSDLTTNDLGVFNSLKRRVKQEHCGIVKGISAGVKISFNKYPAETVEGIANVV